MILNKSDYFRRTNAGVILTSLTLALNPATSFAVGSFFKHPKTDDAAPTEQNPTPAASNDSKPQPAQTEPVSPATTPEKNQAEQPDQVKKETKHTLPRATKPVPPQSTATIQKPAQTTPIISPIEKLPDAITNPSNSARSTLSGNWNGTVNQPGYGNFTASMSLKEENGTIDYPSINCGGTLKLISKEGDAYQFVEHITYGGGCVDGGIISMRVHGDTMNWLWQGRGQSANSVFSRQFATTTDRRADKPQGQTIPIALDMVVIDRPCDLRDGISSNAAIIGRAPVNSDFHIMQVGVIGTNQTWYSTRLPNGTAAYLIGCELAGKEAWQSIQHMRDLVNSGQ